MPAIAQGFATSILMGFETTQGVLPVTPAADKMTGTDVALSPNVNQFTSRAMTGVSRARPWVAGKVGSDGTFTVEASRETLRAPLKALFDQTVTYGTAAAYDHYYYMGNAMPPSFFLEQRHSDITKFLLFLGNQMSVWRQTCAAEGLMESAFTPVGLSMAPFGAEQVTGTITDRTGSNPFNYLTASVKEGGTALDYGTTLEWTVDRKMRRINTMNASPYGYAIIQGELPTLEITLNTLYLDNVLIQKALDGTETSLEYIQPAVESGHGMSVFFPTLKYLPTGVTAAGQGEMGLQLRGMAYGRGAASNVPGEALSKYFTTQLIAAGDNPFKIKVDGGGAQSFTLTTGAARTPAQIVTDLAALTGATAVVEGGRVRIKSSAVTGTLSSIQIDPTGGTGAASLGFDTTVHPGWDGVDVLVRLTDAVATV